MKMPMRKLLHVCEILIAFLAFILFFLYGKGRETTYSVDELSFRSSVVEPGYMNEGSQGCLFSYGPYISLRKGYYNVIIDYRTQKDANAEITYMNGRREVIILKTAKLPAASERVRIKFLCDYINNGSLEIKTYYPGEGELRLNGITVQKKFEINWNIAIISLALLFLFWWGFRKETIYSEKKWQCLFFFCVGIWFSCFFMSNYPAYNYTLIPTAVAVYVYRERKAILSRVSPAVLVSACSYIGCAASFLCLDWILRMRTGAGIGGVNANIFSMVIICFFLLALSLVPSVKWRRWIYGISYVVFCLLLLTNVLYYDVFTKLFSFKDIKLVKEGSDYAGYVLGLVDCRMVIVAVLVLGLGGLNLYLLKYMRRFPIPIYTGIAATVMTFAVYASGLYRGDYGAWDSFASDIYQYATLTDRNRAFCLCGFYQYSFKDVLLTFVRDRKNEKELIRQVDDYYAEKNLLEVPGKEHAYAGIYQYKNVIFFLMESIDDIACTPEVMPNLYRLSQEGMNFRNMYASIYGAAGTMNSELVTNVGLYAPMDGTLVYSFANNYYPYSIANRFKEAGYQARQYHFNSPSFYDRERMNTAFGYKEYVSYMDYVAGKAAENDVVLAQNDVLYQTLIQDEKYFDYVITYSAHLSYKDVDEIVEYSYKKYPELQNMTDSEELNHYYAKVRATDDMLGMLIDRLDEDNLLKDTVIVCVGDHYPYGFSDVDLLYKLSGTEEYKQLLYKVPFVIWTPGGLNLDVEKVCSSIDIVPTLVNLMGLGDISMYVGEDIMSEDHIGAAYFEDGSWVTEDAFYCDGHFVYGQMPSSEVEALQRKISRKKQINDAILLSDYYKNVK